MSATPQERVLAFVCNWAYYAPAEQAELERSLEPGDRLVRLPCSGRLSPEMLLAAVQEGFDAVLLVGCAADSCHYRDGSLLAQQRLETLRRFLLYLGLEPGRVQLFWRSPVAGRPFGEYLAEARRALRAAEPAGDLVREAGR